MRYLLRFLTCLSLAHVATASAELPRVDLFAGMYRISAEVAGDFRSRATGLMHRNDMASNEGMIFIYPEKGIHCMWMRNTLIPLAVAFLDDDGVVLNVEEMDAQTDDNHCARAPARFALEMNSGWFALKRIEPGMQIRGVDKLPSGQ
jgi:uncharacterized membrane protein (UPF0127 family)